MKIQSFLAVGKVSYFDHPIEKQKEYLDRLGPAKSTIDRSYKQYQGQRFFMPFYIKMLNDIMAYCATPAFALLYAIKSLFTKRGESAECIGEFAGMEEILPDCLKAEYDINLDYWFKGNRLSLGDLLFVGKLAIRHPLSPMFVLKNMMKVAKYSHMIYCHQPKAIAVHNEYSFTSSALTEYCRHHNVLHIDVMHGEKLFNIRDSYFEYDRCYVWDEYYVRLFQELNAEKSQFIIALPQSMKINCSQHRNDAAFADYKYYLATTDKAKLLRIKDSMAFAEKKGKSVKYRLHPRYTDNDLAETILGKENIEYPREISILDSISNCGCAVGCYTTVLNQAYNSGIPVLLDDVAEKEMFEKLKDFKYILINKNISTLSSLNCGCKETSNQ